MLQTLPRLPGLTVCLDEVAQLIAAEEAGELESHSGPDDLAYILYTSGSTGKPKGVEIPHRALTNFLCSMQSRPGCSERDTLLAVTTFSFDIAGLELYLPLLSGGHVALASRAEASDGRRLIELIRSSRATVMQATPATWRMLIAAGWPGNRQLRILCGGEALPQDLAEQLHERCGELWNLYGPTETTIWSTIEHVERGARPISIGRPIANTSVYVLDKTLRPVPIGIAGELCIGGHGVARGYRNRPELTAERFIPNPFSTSADERIYRTGDLASYLPDGRLVHLGRLDFQVKIRGFRIEVSEVEARLSRHPAVSEAVVKAWDDSHGMKQLVAYVTVRAGHAQPAPAELRTFVRAALPDYMSPAQFVFLEALPLTANNKVDRNALARPTLEPLVNGESKTEPRGRLEVQLAALWRSVLGSEAVGMHDNFFDMGGHSLKAVQLVSHIERVFGRQLPLATFFQAPTIFEMARLLAKSHWQPSWRSLVAMQPGGSAMPIFAVPGVGGNVLMFARLSRLLGNDRPFYGLQARGLDSAHRPFTSIRKMAAHYVDEIRTVRPQGPYIIAGACTGGVVAFEMVQQLHAAGERATLMMFESWHPSTARAPLFSGALFAPLWYLWAKWTGRNDRTQVTRATWYAIANYKPAPIRGRLLHVIAENRPVRPDVVDTRRVWETLASEGSEVTFSPAPDSGQLFVSPHVEHLAQQIESYLAAESTSA